MSKDDSTLDVAWLNRALNGEPVWNIGQLNRATIKGLDLLARRGDLSKAREHWSGMGPLKTVWFRP